tara:strand:- start:251 stop:1402 length:1152 start_codon:yes stop_codon:yes gene_type:complete
MNFDKNIIVNFVLIIFSLFLVELLSSTVFLFYGEKKYSFLIKPFSKTIEKKINTNYNVRWNFANNRMYPGKYVHKPTINLESGPVVFTINSKGFRGKEFNLKKTTKRIICFGGSTTIGVESPDDQTYPAQLEKIFMNKGREIEVLNFGFGGKSLNFIKDLLYSEAINYEPNIITINSNRNSTMYDSAGTKLSIKKNKLKSNQTLKLFVFLNNNVMTYRLLNKLYLRFLNSQIPSDKILSPYNSKKLHNMYYFSQQYSDTLEEIINFSERNNFKVALIKQAIYIDVEIQKKIESKKLAELLHLLKNLKKKNLPTLDYKDSFLILTNAILNKNMEKLKLRKNIILIDPIEELTFDKENFFDYLHLNPKGNLILAEIIYNQLKNNI